MSGNEAVNVITFSEDLERKIQEYLSTPSWDEKRWKAIHAAEDEYGVPRCQAQIRCSGARAVRVEHVSHEHLFNEPLWDLKAVCKACHEALHETEEEKL